MSSPRLLLCSSDDGLAETLTEGLASVADLVRCPSTANLLTQLDGSETAPAILDYRRVDDGGHGGVRLLEQLQLDFELLPLAILTGRDCPEPLERRAACTGIERFGEPLDVDALREWFRTSCGVTTDASDDEVESVDEVTESVLEGVTRRFETKAPQLKRMLEDLAIAAVHDVTILLIGETGSGKTFLSNLIHEASPRRDQPFIHVACGALPRELIESELFGHVKGAFTSAHADKEGKFVAAGRGTILLDEIDVLGPEQQVKLLRVIETGEFEPVGSNRTLRSQARLVVASNLDLQPLVEQGRFRPDLYYRLNMLKFDIPPLRSRKIDILPLARKFIERFSEKHGVQVEHIDDSLYDALLGYPWPGNVRELEHVIQRAVIYCRSGMLSQHSLPEHILAGNVGPTNDPSIQLRAGNHPDPTLGQQIALTEKEIIEQALFKNNFSRTQTARDLGISRVTLYNKMKKYEMMK